MKKYLHKILVDIRKYTTLVIGYMHNVDIKVNIKM